MASPFLVTIEGSESLTVQCTLQEQHVREWEITDFPVEDGVNISDHIRPKPDVITLDGINSVYGPAGDDGASADSNAVDEAYAFFKAFKSKQELVTVFTEWDVFESMGIKKVTHPRKAQNGGALEFSVEFKEVVVKSVDVTTAQRKRGAPKKTGKTETKQAADPKAKGVIRQFARNAVAGALGR